MEFGNDIQHVQIYHDKCIGINTMMPSIGLESPDIAIEMSELKNKSRKCFA